VAARSFVGRARALLPDLRLIVAPPRTCSTLLARALWNSDSVSSYSHEPFDLVYHRRLDHEAVLEKLAQPLLVGTGAGGCALVKELSFQVGRYFPALASLTDRPVIFIIRDPRLSIASRMQLRRSGGAPAVFPVVESGWNDLAWQVAWCRDNDRPYAIVDAADLLTRPRPVLQAIATELGVAWSHRMLHWRPAGDVDLALALDQQVSWNARVLSSRGFEPPAASPPALEEFPVDGGMREHVDQAQEIHRRLLADPSRLHT
jgi:hypothetical protein